MYSIWYSTNLINFYDISYISITPLNYVTNINFPNFFIFNTLFFKLDDTTSLISFFIYNIYNDMYSNMINKIYAFSDLVGKDLLLHSQIYSWWFDIFYKNNLFLSDMDLHKLYSISFSKILINYYTYLNTHLFDNINVSTYNNNIITPSYIYILLFLITSIFLFSAIKNIKIYNYEILIIIKFILINSYLSKIYKYSLESLFLFFVFFFYYIINIMLVNETVLDSINSWSFFGIWIYVICFYIYLYKYNINFFSFLELSNIETYSYKYVTKQYMRDVTNVVAHILRLILLFLRLNIYDGLDDVFDSYYIFVGDFNIYEYYDIISLYFTNNTFVIDNTFDLSLTRYTESSYNITPIYVYTTFIYKLFLFLFFLTEGVLRICLATYIILLLSLEINNFNVIYKE